MHQFELYLVVIINILLISGLALVLPIFFMLIKDNIKDIFEYGGATNIVDAIIMLLVVLVAWSLINYMSFNIYNDLVGF